MWAELEDMTHLCPTLKPKIKEDGQKVNGVKKRTNEWMIEWMNKLMNEWMEMPYQSRKWWPKTEKNGQKVNGVNERINWWIKLKTNG